MIAENEENGQVPIGLIVAGGNAGRGRATAARNWKADEGLALILEAKALGVDDNTVSSDSRWETLGNNVAKSLNISTRTVNSNIDHLKTMVKVVRSMSSSYSMSPNAIQCPQAPSAADEVSTELFNTGIFNMNN